MTRLSRIHLNVRELNVREPNVREVALLLLAWTLVFTQPAHAYIDPGTGNFIFQLLLGTIVGAMATFKIWWSRVLAFVKPKSKP